MTECWLRPNYRPAYFSIVLAIVLAIAGIAQLYASWRLESLVWGIMSAVCIAFALYISFGAFRALRQSRVTYENGRLFVHDGSSSPPSVPIDAVEAFFLGSGPIIPDAEEGTVARAANVVIRIAEADTEFHDGDLAEAIGKWNEGYIVLRGTWCEPIGHERLNKINRRLAEIHRIRREQATDSTKVTA